MALLKVFFVLIFYAELFCFHRAAFAEVFFRETEVFYMSKRGGYYGLYVKKRSKTELLFDSGELLRNTTWMATYQIAFDVSQDGKFLAFHALGTTLNMDIFILDLKTGKLKNLTKDPDVDSSPVFSHDGKWIAYLSHERGVRRCSNISLISADGKLKKRLTGDFFNISSPSFSPDDRSILFVKYLPFHSAISRADLATGEIIDLTTFAFSNRCPSFSPDGKLVAFASDEMGSFDIWLMNADGSGKRLLYESPGFEYDPNFTPDGRGLCFISDFEPAHLRKNWKGGNTLLYVEISGENPVNLIPKHFSGKGWYFFHPRFSNDGGLLAFHGKHAGRLKSVPYSAYILDLKSSKIHKVHGGRYNNTEPIAVVR